MPRSLKEEENVARCPYGAAVHLAAPAFFCNGSDDAGMADGLDGAPRGVPVNHDDLNGIEGGLRANMRDDVIDAPRFVQDGNDHGDRRVFVH